MGTLFLTSFFMSLVIFIVLIHRKIRGHRFSSKAYYIIWLIIAIRLILPFDISINNSIYNFNSFIKEYEVSNYKNGEEQTQLKLPYEENNVKKFNFIRIVRRNLFNVWLIGTILYLIYNLFFYFIFKHSLKKSLFFVNKDIEEKFYGLKTQMVPRSKVVIRESDLIDSPMIIGIIKPMLLISENTNVENISYILDHEFTHLKRKDLLYKLIIFLAVSIHWFNPVVHLMRKVSTEDLELSCDEEVIKGMNREYRIEYSKTLIESISNRNKVYIMATNYSGGKEMIKKRLDKILDSIRKKTGKSLVLALILVILSTSILVSCGSEEWKVLADELYSYKTEYPGYRHEKSNILSFLEFKEKEIYKIGTTTYEGVSLEENPYILRLYFNGDASETNIDDFKYESTILFALIDKLDHVTYTVRENSEEIEIGTLTRDNIDSMIVSVLGMNTEELGSSKRKFNKLVAFYEEVKRDF